MKTQFWGTILMAVAAAAMLSGCASTKTTRENDFAALVQAIFDEYTTCNCNEDADGYVALWDEEGIKLKPKQPAVIGKAALAEMKRSAYQKWDYLSQKVNIEEVHVDREWGFVRGTAETTAKPRAGGDDVTSEAKFLTIFKRQKDGSWKIYCDSVT